METADICKNLRKSCFLV